MATKPIFAGTSPVKETAVGAFDEVGGEDEVGELLGDDETEDANDTEGCCEGLEEGCVHE